MSFYDQTMAGIRASEWKPALDPYGRGFLEGFDSERAYDFRRYPDTETKRYRLADMSPFFNIAGLYWRDPNFKAQSPQSPPSPSPHTERTAE